MITKTPLGTKLADVRNICNQEGWSINLHGMGLGDSWNNKIVARLGSYQGFPWYVSVDAIWKFNKANELEDITIIKTTDSP
jgi:hypothetical protein